MIVKWNGTQFQIELHEEDVFSELKKKLFELTGVFPERQKIMAKGRLIKHTNDMKRLDWRQAVFLLCGSTEDVAEACGDVVVAPPKCSSIPIPCGIENLGNTCYLGATLQCIGAMPEIVEAVVQHYKNTPSQGLQPRKQTLGQMGALYAGMISNTYVSPVIFVRLFRLVFSQFDQTGSDGVFLQQDAEECYLMLIDLLRECPYASSNVVEQFLEGELTISCENEQSESIQTSREPFIKLNCHITQSTNDIYASLRFSMEEWIETPYRCGYKKVTKISRLPTYLIINFVRFFWKQNQKTKAKILKRVSFPHRLDMYEFCSPELQDAKDPGVENSSTGWTYELVAVLTHQGRTADQGHYVAWTRNNHGWWKHDDDNVSAIREEDVLKLDGGGEWHSAYMCFYRAAYQ